MVIFLIMAAYDYRGCYVCMGREGVFCWLVALALFLAIILPLLGLLV